jgi:hypothetical protein
VRRLRIAVVFRLRGVSVWSCACAMAILLGGGLLVRPGIASGQSRDPGHGAVPTRVVDSGSWYSRNRWPHDGRPYESRNFVVYSDAASTEARHRLAEVAEGVLAETIAEMGVDPQTMFRFPTGQKKIDVYAYRNHVPDWGGGARAYYAGVIIWSFDHAPEADKPTDLVHFRPVLKHELVHVVEALLKGRFVGDIPVGDPRRMPVWFSEGMAEALSGGTSGGLVRDLDQMNGLIAEYGRINPIAFTVDLTPGEFDPLAYYFYYYPMSQLAVEYLIDPKGLGRSPADFTRMLLDMASGVSFATAFENHMGISVSTYEKQFFDLMDAYLPQGSDSRATRILVRAGRWAGEHVALFSIAAIAVVALTLISGQRHWRAGAAAAMTPAGQSVIRRQWANVGFTTEIIVAAALVVGFFVWVMYAISTAVEPSSPERAWGYATDVGYGVVAVAILLWSIRCWAFRRRAAAFMPLLEIAVGALAALVITAIF